MNTIHCEHVDVAYKKKKGASFYALKNISFSTTKGKVFCLLGPNGSGKTTTVNIINGLNRPTNGSVKVMDLNPVRHRYKVRQKMSVVPQETALYNDLTGRENLQFHAAYYGVEPKRMNRIIDKMLDLVGLTKRQNDRVSTYSGGMQRRLSLARALLTSPEIILLDEPTLGVDVQSRNEIWNQIRTFASEGKTVLLTTNYMEEAEILADEIMIIDKGEHIITDTPNKLKEHIQENKLVLQFNHQETTAKAYEKLKDMFHVHLEEDDLRVALESKSSFVRVLQKLDDLANHIRSFEMKEPSLNDVFLHFTGRELRN